MRGQLYFVGGDGNVWSFDSSGAHRVTHTTAIDGAYITPNGHKIVYYRRWVDTVADVWLQNLRTGGVQQITHDRATDGVVQDNLWAVNPVISPDGKTIIYESDAYKLLASPAVVNNPDCGTAPANGGIDLALYSYDVATGTANQLTAPCWGAGGDADPRFDPTNPNRIVYTEFYYLPNSSIASRLVVMNIVTGARYDISPFRGRNMQPAWQPNGRHLAWLGSSDQSTTLYEAAFYHGVLHRGTTRRIDSGLISQPVFSPDGKHLAYFKLVSNNFQIWAVNLKEGWPVGKPEQLLSGPSMVASSPLVWTR
jgi:Tol biopolymer transport system component